MIHHRNYITGRCFYVGNFFFICDTRKQNCQHTWLSVKFSEKLVESDRYYSYLLNSF